MKAIPILIIVALTAFVAIVIYSQFQPEAKTDLSAINALKNQNKTLAIEKVIQKEKIVALEERIDSLENVPEQIEKEIIYLTAKVDSVIADDSSKVVSEYRKGLALLQIRPDISLDLSTREKGLGALIFRETYGFRLKTPVLEEANLELHKSIGQHKRVIAIGDSIQTVDSLTIAGFDLIIKELDNWWRHRFSISLGVGISWIPNYGFQPSVGIQAGVNLWRKD